jgi:lipoprotein-releasing system permease protein
VILSRYERMIARRYLLPGKGEGFIFLVASISLVAVMLGVAALIVVMSVMNGFRAELFDKIIGLNGHAVVQGYGGRLPDWREIVQQARRTPGVTSAIPLIEQPLMASNDGRMEGVLLRGMERGDILRNGTLRGKVLAGSLDTLQPGSGNVAVGARLAEALGVTVGGQISLLSAEGRTTPFGTVPRIVSYHVSAIFEVGIYDYDKAFVLMPIEDAQTFLMMPDEVGMVEVQTADADRVEQILAPLGQAVAGRAVVTDWRQLNSSLFQALQVERVAMFVILSIIILVAVFNILSSLIMLVRAKTRDIAILRTMGATRRAHDQGLHDRRGDDRRDRHRRRPRLGALLPLFPPGLRQFRPAGHRPESLGSLDPIPDRASGKDRSVRGAAIVVMALLFSFLATLYPGLESGEHRSGPGAEI